MFDVRMQRHVEDAVRLERDDRVDVIGRHDPGGLIQLGELAGILADLVLAEGIDPDQFEVAALEDGRSACRATLPVVHCTTRYLRPLPPDIRPSGYAAL